MRELNESNFSPIKIWASDLEASAETQIRNTASLPFIYRHIAVMPDAHAGRGSTIGTVIATQGAIIPSAVGVDIGCGMSAIKLPFDANSLGNLKDLRNSIERSIPTGRESNREVTTRAAAAFTELGLPPSFPQETQLIRKAATQLGTLGGGNHFIEVCIDKQNSVWIMLHSGSRNIGKELAEIHISKAKGLIKERLLAIPDPDLAYFTEDMPEFKAYIGDLLWAQNYAKYNRNEMVLRVLKDISFHVFKDPRLLAQVNSFFRVDCHHNFCQIENHFGNNVWITRKGAVSAKEGQYGIIPGSMGAKSYIVKGKGNPDSFHSCSHGAGRKMSRTEARKRFSESDLKMQTEGVECRKDLSIVDEIPSAYKDIDQVMRDQSDLVEVAFELKQILCIKGA